MFQNREEAGLLLARKLINYQKDKDTIVLAIPRGGVVVGRQIAERLSLPLSIIVVKKLGAPGNPELAIGALAPSGVKYIDWDLTLRSGVEQEYLDREIKDKSKEIEEREKRFGTKNLELSTKNYKVIILVDDGVATGATTLTAIKYIKQLVISPSTLLTASSQQPTIILAVPVIAEETYDKLKIEVDKIVALGIPESFSAVGQFYREFPQVTDEEVIKILRENRR